MNKKLIILTSILLLGCSPDALEYRDSVSSQELSLSHHAIINPVMDTYYSRLLTGVAAIFIVDQPEYKNQVYCSGTLITPRHVLTAAHCIANLSGKFALVPEDEHSPDCQWTAKFVSSGTNQLFNYVKVGFGVAPYQIQKNLYDIKSVTYHTGYAHVANAVSCQPHGYDGYEYTENDIAILELTNDIPEDVATPIPVLPPWLAITQEEIKQGIRIILAGYGYDQTGYKGYRDWTYLKFTSYCGDPANNHYCTYDNVLHVKGCPPTQKNCDSKAEFNYEESRLAFPKSSFFYLQKESGPCNGDSGGPAIRAYGKRLFVAGITSYGDKICKGYGVSTAVQDYYNWIINIVPEMKQYYIEDCHNYVDDDNDGLVDHDDPECADEYFCGDGIVQDNEWCDGNSFYNNLDLCNDWNLKYESGKVTCTSDCKINYDHCVEFSRPGTCGNGVIDSEEQCDGNLFQTYDGSTMNSDLCSEFSSYFNGGSLKCSPSCRLETEDCVFYDETNQCDNGILEPGEICDGTQFANGLSSNCRDFDTYFISGKLSCYQCKIDFSLCTVSDYCGDGLVSGEEPCENDHFLFDENTCEGWTRLYKAGNVTCNSNCSVDYSNCVLNDDFADLCGNGKIDRQNISGGSNAVIEELCDGDVFPKGNNCADLDPRYIAGKVSCRDNCSINYENCQLSSDTVDDESYSLVQILSNEQKPKIIALDKSKDAITFYKGDANQIENLTFHDISNATNPDTPTNPDIPSIPVTPDSKPLQDLKNSGCNAMPASPCSPFSMPVLVIIAVAWAWLRRKKSSDFIHNDDHPDI